MSKYAPKTLFCDNQGAISLAKNPTHHAKTKHVDVQLHFIRDHVEQGTINVEYCPTEDMLADLMTKGLPHERHKRLLGLMGVGTTTPSPIGHISRLGKTGMEPPSGSVELRRHHAGRIMRWTPRIIGKDNGAVARIVRNNMVAADIVRK